MMGLCVVVGWGWLSGWLCGGVKFVCVGLCMVIAVRLAWRLSDWF
ncbi:hypothetical protein [Campylobacter porcelli]|nr:hypothetical protein [Campylobacter sp. P0078]